MIRTTNDTIRTLLLHAHLPARFWAEGLHTSTYLLNRLPSTACPAPTPHQALFGTPSRYDHLRVFGCACYPNTAATAPHKLAPRSTLCVFLGYSPNHKGYRCFDLSSRRVLISRHVVFDESVFSLLHHTHTTFPDPDLDLSLPFRLTRWSSHLYFLFLQVLACRLSLLLPARCLARVRWCRLRWCRHRPPVTTSSAVGPLLVPPARFAQPMRVYQRRLPLPGFAPPPPLSPPPPSSPLVTSSPAAPLVAQSPPGTPTPPPRPPVTRVQTPVYHPPLLYRDPRHVHLMVTRHAAGTLPPRVLAATPGDSQVSPVPSSVRTALLDPHWHRAMEEEYAALVANQT
jgi:hypothetical protein